MEHAEENFTGLSHPIAIVGIGARFPKAPSLQAFWNNIKRGVDGIGDIPPTHWDPADYFDGNPKAPDKTYGTKGGFLDPVDFYPLDFGIPPNQLEATDTSQLLAMHVARDALRDAGLDPDSPEFPRDRASCILGVTSSLELLIPLGARLGHPVWRKSMLESGVPVDQVEKILKRMGEGFVSWQEASFPGLLGNVVAGRIANRFNLHGSNCVVDAACASSLSAVHMACMELESGRADLVVSGGVDTFNDIFMYMCFSKTPALSPTGHARPFDKDGDGTTLGEGIGILVLKRLADAEAAGDRIYAVIRGIGSSSDGRGHAIYAPSSEGQARALRHAYRMAGVTPDSIDLVEAHGTGTRKGDEVELSALVDVYRGARARGTWAAVGSIKSMVGHTKAAAGVAGLIKAALSLRYGSLPPTLKVKQPLDVVAPHAAPLYINTEQRPWIARERTPRRAAVSAFGFGGSNYHCVLETPRNAKEPVDFSGDVQLLALSGSAGDVAAALKSWDTAAHWQVQREKLQVLRREFRPNAPVRAIAILDARDQAKHRGQLDALASLAAQRGNQSGVHALPGGDALGVGQPEGKLALLFPGQGAQYVNMLRELCAMFPEARESFAIADECLEGALGQRISEIVYPLPVFDDTSREAQSKQLTDTRNAQPALAAASVAMLKVLRRFGVTAAMSAGHSFGELVALHSAGVISERDLVMLARRRGELMSAGSQRLGGMLAVMAPIGDIRDSLERFPELTLANENTPEQGVVSGELSALKRFETAANERRWRVVPLQVSSAFHCELVAGSAQPFSQALSHVPVNTPTTPVYSNTTAESYPQDPNSIRELLANQLARPVRFIDQIERMHADGAHCFVECGPGNRLSAMVSRILGGRDHLTLAVDSSSGKRDGELDLARLLASLAARGESIKLAEWDADFDPQRAPVLGGRGPKYDICGANYRSNKPTWRIPSDTRSDSTNAPSATAARNGVASSNRVEAASGGLEVSAHVPGSGTSLEPTRQAAHLPAMSVAATPRHNFASSAGVQERNQTVNPSGQDQSNDDVSASSMRLAQQSLRALARMQEQAASLHEQYLRAQEEASQALEGLLQEHERLSRRLPAVSASGSPAVPASATRTESRSTAAPVPAAQPVKPKLVEVLAPAHVPDARPVSNDAAVALLMQVVAEKTGYPAEMLQLDMELDADLGIDSIKRVEILSAMQERMPDAQAVEPEQLGRFQTLRQVAEYLGASSAAPPALAPVTVAPASIADPALTQAATTSSTSESVAVALLLEVVAEKTGYPADMLQLDMELDADLGIDSIKRVEILSAMQERMPNAPVVEPEQLGRFQTLRQVADYLGATSSGAPPVDAPAPSPQVPAAALAASADATDAAEKLLQVVAEKTGYPADMLQLDMELDADLGIDSIKRVEILSAMQEAMPGVPVIEPDQLGSFRTLRDVVNFLSASGNGNGSADSDSTRIMSAPAHDGDNSEKATAPLVEDLTPSGRESSRRNKATKRTAPVPKESPYSPTRNVDSRALSQRTSRVIGLHRTVLKPRQVKLEAQRLETSMPFDAPLWIVDDGSDLSDLVCNTLINHGYDATVVNLRTAASHVPERLAGLVLLTPESDPPANFVRECFLLVQACSKALRSQRNHGLSKLIAVTRLGGQFGLDSSDMRLDASSSGVCGIIKTVAEEWSEVRSQVIDLMPAGISHLRTMATEIVDEMNMSGPVEVGIRSGRVFSLTLEDATHGPLEEIGPFNQGDLVVATGGARGVTAACAVTLARACKCTLLLLGRSAAPTREEAWLAGVTEESAIKQALLARESGLTPKELQSRFREVMANREMMDTIAKINAVGGRALYASIDVRDQDSIEAVLESAREQHGPVRGIIHGAGVLADRLIDDQSAEQFDRVYETKVAGFEHLLNACHADPLRAVAAFSSTTARFGRKGQVAYAAANETLNKMCQVLATQRPDCRVVSINWGPWEGGMVTPALKKVFESEGIGLIPQLEGSLLLLDEVRSPPGSPVEVIVLKGRELPESVVFRSQETVTFKSDDKERIVKSVRAEAASGGISVAFRLNIDVASFPVLKSHVIDSMAVVPSALMLEWFAQAALKNNPGLHLIGVNHFTVLRGITLDTRSVAVIDVMVAEPKAQGSALAIDVEIRDERAQPRARATVMLGGSLPTSSHHLPPLDLEPFDGQVYGDGRLFHGAHLQGIRSVNGIGADGFEADLDAAPNPARWLAKPMRNTWIMDPLAIDCALQACILWGWETQNMGCLPSSIESYQQFQRAFPGEGTTLTLACVLENAHTMLATAEFVSPGGNLVARMEGIRMTLSPGLQRAFAENSLARFDD